MKTLNDLKIINADYDLEFGFFWVEFDNNESLQCCIKNAEPVIEIGNCGHDEGCSADANIWAVEQGFANWDGVENFLIEQARKKGLSIVA
jgi:hypothetical protein